MIKSTKSPLKNILLFTSSLLFVFFSGCATTPNSGGLALPKYSDRKLSNGLQVLTIEDHSLPYVTVGLLVKTGASEDPIGKSGLADLTSSLLERGTSQHSAEQLADAFGQLGTSFSNFVNHDYTYLSTSGLAMNQKELFDLFFEVIMKPQFAVNEVNRLKGEIIADIKRSYDQPSYVAGRFFGQLLFGVHPYGRLTSGTIRDVEAIRQKDINRLYLKSYRPNNAILVLVGDLSGDVVKELDTQLSTWEARPVEVENKYALVTANGLQLQLVDRSDLKQTEVRMGHYGVKRAIDDYQALGVAEEVFSGGFTGRLMSEIRVKRGLTYGIRSSFDARKEIGPFTIASNTRHEKVGELVQETLNVYARFYKEGATEQEVEDAKGYLAGVFPRSIETPEDLARALVALRFYGIEDAYLFDYIKNLNKITVSEVNKVIKKYYHPDQMRILIYGPKDKVIEQLRPIGAVEVKNYRELL